MLKWPTQVYNEAGIRCEGRLTPQPRPQGYLLHRQSLYFLVSGIIKLSFYCIVWFFIYFIFHFYSFIFVYLFFLFSPGVLCGRGSWIYIYIYMAASGHFVQSTMKARSQKRSFSDLLCMTSGPNTSGLRTATILLGHMFYEWTGLSCPFLLPVSLGVSDLLALT